MTMQTQQIIHNGLTSRPALLQLCLLLTPLMLMSCGGGNSSTPSDTPIETYTISGTVNGLNGSDLVLRINDSTDLTISGNGSLFFTTALASGTAYDIRILTQATNQNCIVNNGSGIVTGNIDTIAVNCYDLQSVVFQRTALGSQYDVYLIKEDGTGLVPLAATAEDERYMFATPDRKIIFERGLGTARSVYSVNADGTNEVLLASNAYARPDVPSVTSSGRIILTRTNDLISVNGDGTGLVDFGGTAGNESFIGLAPDGKVIFQRFDTTQTDINGIYSANEDGSGEIKLSPVNTTEYELVRAITHTGRVIYELSAASASGNQRDLYSVKEDGTGLVTLANSIQSEEFVALLANERVVYQRGGDLYSINADGSGTAALTSGPNTKSFVGATADGKVIYMQYLLDPITQLNQGDIYIINGDGTGAMTLAATSDNEVFSGVTPGGKILFIRETGGQLDLYSINADGTGELRLTNTPENESFNCVAACFTPNGRLIFSRHTASSNQTDLYSINPDGTGEVLLTNGTDWKYVSGVTASSRVIFTRNTGGIQNDLFSINVDGTNLKTLMDTLDNDLFADVISP